MLIQKRVGLAGEAVALGTAFIALFYHTGSNGAFIAPVEFTARAHAAFAVDVLGCKAGLIVFAPALGYVLFLGLIATLGGQITFAAGAVKSAGG